MKYQFNRKFQAGTSMVYVLAALIVTGFIGGAMIKMMGSERTANALYATSASARNAAKSGIIAAIHRFENETNFALDTLQDWINKPTNTSKWVVGKNTGVEADDYEEINADHRYRTQLVAFDKENHNITLMAEGIGKGGARATVTGVYHLDGLTIGKKYDWSNENALYIGDGISLDLRGTLIVNGNVYIGENGTFTFDGNVHGTKFKENFILDKNSTLEISASSGNDIYYEGRTYFGVQPTFTGGIRFLCYKNVGFEEGVDFGVSASNYIGLGGRGGHSFWNGDLLGGVSSGRINHHNDTYSGNMLYHNGGFNPVEVDVDNTNKSPVSAGGAIPTITTAGVTKIDIPKALGIDLNQCDILVDTNAIPDGVIVDFDEAGTFDVAKADAYWNDSKPLWQNKFRVIRLQRTMNVGGKGDTFDKNIIIITNGEIIQPAAAIPASNTGMFNTGPNGSFSIINTSGGKVKEIGGWSYMKGFFWSEAGTEFKMGGSHAPVDTLEGAIHVQGGGGTAMEWYPINPGPGAADADKAEIIYDASILSELDYNGFLNMVNCDNDEPTIITDKLEQPGAIYASVVSESI